jgi:excinuclease ABC subunit C
VPARSPTLPGSYQFKDAHGRVIYVGKASSLRQRLSNYFQDPAEPAPAHRADGGHGRDRRVDPGPQRGRGADARVLLIKQHRPRFNVRLRDDKSYPFLAVTVDESGRGRWSCGAASARAPATSALRPRLRHPRDPRPAAAQLPDPHLLSPTSSSSTSGSAGRACCSTSRSAPGRASARSRRCRTASSSPSCCEFLDGDTDEIVDRLEAEMRTAADRARVRAGRPAARPARGVRKAIEKQQMVAERDEDLDVVGIAEDELEPLGAGLLRAQGPGGRPQGVHPRQGRGPQPGSWSTGSSRASTATSRRSVCPSRCSSRRARRRRHSTRSGSRSCVVAGSRSGSPSAATSATLLETVTRNATEEFTRHRLRGRATTTAGPRRSTSCRTCSSCPRRRCASSATT